jgi:hypothetical protein
MHARAQRLLKQKADSLRAESHILSSTRTGVNWISGHTGPYAFAFPLHARHPQDLSGPLVLGAFFGAPGDCGVALSPEATREKFRTCGRVLKNTSPTVRADDTDFA